jgi:hypothetical protein
MAATRLTGLLHRHVRARTYDRPRDDGRSDRAVEAESPKEQERRRWAERQETLRDREEEYERAVAVASPEERRRLMQEFGEYRRSHREEDVRMGKRPPGVSVAMHRIMWKTWIEVAVEHELDSRRAFLDIVANPETGAIVREFNAALVAITAAAYTIEAVYGDIKYRIPVQPREHDSDTRLTRALEVAFGVAGDEAKRMKAELAWLFRLRGSVVHAYTESEPPAQHPAGINAGAEHSNFNAYTSGRAVDAAFAVLAIVGSPPVPHGRWIERWVEDRLPYQAQIAALQGERTTKVVLPPSAMRVPQTGTDGGR